MELNSFIIRPVNLEDLKNLHLIAQNVGAGFTSIPNDKGRIQSNIEISINTFANKKQTKPRIYLLVLEEYHSNKFAGICGIKVNVNEQEILYDYKISSVEQYSKELNKTVTHEFLIAENSYKKVSEVFSLYLFPEFRGKHVGELLSRSRFLFIAAFREKFLTTIIAEIRGNTRNQNNIFWETVGRPFYNMDFKEADLLASTSGKKCIFNLIPKYPIYVDLFPKDLKDTFGVPHKSSHPAQILLKKEGFVYNNFIDLFDGGPILEAKINDIETVKNKKSGILTDYLNPTNKTYQLKKVMICNCKQDFRLIISNIFIDKINSITMSKTDAEKLLVNLGDKLYYVNFDTH